MSSKNSNDRDKQAKAKANPHLKSSIVHKPFATGTINIFNPHRQKTSSKLSAPNAVLSAELEKTPDELTGQLASDFNAELLNPDPEIVYRDRTWVDNLLSPWGISAIALLFLANLVSAGFIWRNTRLAERSDKVETPVSSVGKTNLAAKEFVPLNLSTLGTIKTTPNEPEDSSLELAPIAPALAPLEDIASLSSFNTPYHYVLTEYTGERSLADAQKQVKQVSLVNFPQGVFIYLGAFKDRQDAEQFVSGLKQNNFSAYVYPLD